MEQEEKISKLEGTIGFLKKELESQNLAILRLERAMESGEGLQDNDKQKPVLTLADMEFTLFGIEEKLKKHNELLKSIVISLVGLNDLLEEIRDLYRNSLADIQYNQENQMNSYLDLFTGSMSSLRAEFLMVLRDFREKYPKLEEIKISEQSSSAKSSLANLETDVENHWTPQQLNDINRRIEHMELMMEQNLSENLIKVNQSINYLMTKSKEIDLYLKEVNLQKPPNNSI